MIKASLYSSLLLLGLTSATGTGEVHAQEPSLPEGAITVASHFDVNQTTDKLQKVLTAKGMKVFTVIDHAAGAQQAGLELRPTKLVLFGNPKVGTPLMQCQQSVALDLPQKALIWEDMEGKTWLTYNDPAYLQSRHQIPGCEAVLTKVSGALSKFAAAATKAP